MNWIVFSYSLPTKSMSSPRVTLWRRLRRLGTVTLSGGAQVLPARDECIEALQWLAQEIRQAKGDAIVMRVEQFDGLTDQQVVDLFDAARVEEYKEIENQIVEFQKTLGRRIKPDDVPPQRQALAKLRRRYAEIARVDYFNSPTGSRVASKLAEIEEILSPKAVPPPVVEPAAIKEYRGKCWVTRPRPHVDRLACAWLIRRFIDAEATIRYATRPKSDEVTFDTDVARFGHVGNLCTFETMLLAFSLDDPGLRAVAEIVHEIDLQDGRYLRPETQGVDAILKGWLQLDAPDAELEVQGIALFEGLYAALSV
jgi:hypothetical protein